MFRGLDRPMGRSFFKERILQAKGQLAALMVLRTGTGTPFPR